MSFGLGKNSPVVLTQTRSNFEALIHRHGQWLRWRIAKSCPCIKDIHYDIHCERCGGVGDIYDYQREYEDFLRLPVRGGIITLPDVYTAEEVLEVKNSKGLRVEFSRFGSFIGIEFSARNNEFFDVRFRVSIVKEIRKAVLEKVGGCYYRVRGITVEPSSIAGVYYKAAGDIIEAESVKGENGEEFKIVGYSRDMIRVECGTAAQVSAASELTAFNVKYILPFKFVVLSQESQKPESPIIKAHSGEAVCTYPYQYNLSENDVLTVLSGSNTAKIVLPRKAAAADDIIPEFFVERIDSVETVKKRFIEGGDYILIGTNKIHWIGEKPEAGESMSIVYRYNPTYRVTKSLPMLRTSENQRMPRKAVISLFTAFSEKKGVNRNGGIISGGIYPEGAVND